MKPGSPEVAANRILKLSRLRPSLAIVLGTGSGEVIDSLQLEQRLPYRRIPGFPSTGVSGHAGELLVGRFSGEPVYVLRGRVHFYEGHPMWLVTFAVRTLAACGVRHLLLTNAAGAINPRFKVGDLMIIEDHINLMGANPLCGLPVSDQSRFLDLSQVYDPDLRRLLQCAAKDCGLKLRKGVYLAVSGPSYETPAEIRAFGRLGADAVGMSTVPETIVARQCGLRVAGLSCITNLASGRAKGPLDHSDVLKKGVQISRALAELLCRFAEFYGSTAEVSH